MVKNTTMPITQLLDMARPFKLEILTFNGGELESSPQDKLGSGTSSPTQL